MLAVKGHPNVLQVLALERSEAHVFVVLPWCETDLLDTVTNAGGGLDAALCHRYFIDVLSGACWWPSERGGAPCAWLGAVTAT